MQNLSEDLHAKLDAMGAPPRAMTNPVPTTGESPSLRSVPDAGETLDTAPIPADTPAPEGESLEDESLVGEEEQGNIEAQASETPAADAGETQQQYKPGELAEAIGWTAEELYKDLIVPISENESLSLGEIKDKWGDLETQRAEITQQRGALEEQAKQLQQQYAALGNSEGGLSKEIDDARRMVIGVETQYENFNWEALEKEDAGKAANLRQKFLALHGQATQQLKDAETKFQGESQAAMNQQILQEDQRLLAMVPEWKEQKVFETEMPEVRKYLESRGFTTQELGTIFHAGARAVARDAWLWNQHKDKIKGATKKIRSAPKPVLRSGGSPGKAAMDDKRISDLSNRALQTGRNQDKLSALRAIVNSQSGKR